MFCATGHTWLDQIQPESKRGVASPANLLVHAFGRFTSLSASYPR